MLMTNLDDERLTTAHRAKLAYVYVRQSSVVGSRAGASV